MSTISDEHQVTIPAEVLRAAGLRPGDELWASSSSVGRIDLVETDALIDEYAGSLGKDAYPPGHLEELRAESE